MGSLYLKRENMTGFEAKGLAAPERKRINELIVVGIGATSGGLEALKLLLPNLPEEANMSYVIVPHLDANQKTIIEQLLVQHTKIKVVEIRTGQKLEANTIYLTPPNSNVSVSREILLLSYPLVKQPIDYFFTFLALDKGDKAIGIILSGTGIDGAYGIRAVKAEGGRAIVQDEKTARFPEMPNASIATGQVDSVLPPEKISGEIQLVVTEKELSVNDYLSKIASNHYGPAGVLIDNKTMKIVHIKGNVNPFLNLVPGEAELNILKMAREELQLNLMKLIQTSVQNRIAVRSKKVKIVHEGAFRLVTLDIRPLYAQNDEVLTMILFEEETLTQNSAMDYLTGKVMSKDTYINELKQRLAATKEQLQKTISELDSANRELQSTKDELITVNDELMTKSVELSSVTTDFKNIQSKIGIALVVVDMNLHVCRFTHHAVNLFDISAKHIGQPIASLKCRFDISNLQRFLAETIQQGRTFEEEVGVGNKTYLMQVFPYYRDKNQIAGAIVIFLDKSSLKDAEQKLDQKIKEFALIQRIAHIASWEWDILSDRITWTEEFKAIVGFEGPTLSGSFQDFLTLIYPDDVDKFDEFITHCKVHQRECSLDHRIIRPDGAIRWVSEIGYALRDKYQKVTRFVGIIEDVTEIKLFKEKVVQERRILNALADDICILDKNYRILSANNSFFNLYGQESTVLGKRCFEIFHCAEGDKCDELDSSCPFKIASKTKKPSSHIHTHLVKGGSKFVKVALYPILDEKGEVESFVHISSDLAVDSDVVEKQSGADWEKSKDQLVEELHALRLATMAFRMNEHERAQLKDKFESVLAELDIYQEKLRIQSNELKSANDALETLHIKYMDLYNFAPIGYFAFDQSGLIKDVNLTAVEMLGYERQDLIDKSLFDFVHNSYRDALKLHFLKAFNGDAVTTEIKLESADNSVFLVEMKSVLIHDVERKTAYCRSGVTKISVKDKTKEDVYKVENLESFSVVASGIAHDLNNILTTIIGNLTALKQYASEDDKLQLIVKKIEKASLQAKDLARQLLLHAKGEALEEETISLKEIIDEACLIALSDSNIEYALMLPDKLWQAQIHPKQLSQVVSNLIYNARQAMSNKGLISVLVENVEIDSNLDAALKEGAYIKITIQDQGVGIPKELLNKILTPYVTTKKTGYGLGLFTVQSILKKNNGYLQIESEVGKGTTVYVYAPALKKDEIIKEPSQHEITFGSGRILIMDDEEMVRDTVGCMLKHLGYEVAYAADGEEAIQLYAQAEETAQPYAAIIMDLTIPNGIGGKEAIKRLHQHFPDAKAIVSSGYSTAALINNYQEYGFCGVISKPFCLKELSVLLSQVVNNDK
jgi:PAS domain S-box-containing protein